MLRIGFYTPNYPGITQEGGIGTYTRDLGHALAELGHEVHILTPGEGESVKEASLTIHFTSTKYLPIADRAFPGAGACWRVGSAMKRIAQQHQLDIIEFPNWEGYGLWFQTWNKTPNVTRLHTSSKESQLIDNLPKTRTLGWDIKRERWQARRANGLITHSEAHRKMMVEELDVPAEQIHLIPHGVPFHDDFVRKPHGGEFLEVVFLGRMEKRKGTIDLIDAVPKVLEQVPNTRFTFIGSDRAHCPGNRTHAQYVAEELPAHARAAIHFAGRLVQHELDKKLQTADLFCAPSRYESFGLIFPETMRWGTPVIGTLAGGIPEIIQHEKTGWLVPHTSPGDLATAIIHLLKHEELRKRIGDAGRKHVEEHFNIERVSQKVASLYEQIVIGGVGRPAPSAGSNGVQKEGNG